VEKEDKNHEPAVKKGVDLVGIVKTLGKRHSEKVK
jgi:hypothetical protein